MVFSGCGMHVRRHNLSPLVRPRLLAFLFACWLVGPGAQAANIEDVDQLIKDQRYEKALLRLDELLLTRRNDPDLLLRKGICQSMLGRFSDAEASFNSVLAVDPKEPRFLYNLGLLRLREKRFDEAERLFHETLAVRPWHPEVNYHLGVICEGRGDMNGAVDYYKRELNLNGRCAKAWQRWYVLKGTGNTDNHVSWAAILFGVGAAAVGMLVLYWQKKSDDEEMKCAS